jgi:outer membrane PBP1 activator LpoA protein
MSRRSLILVTSLVLAACNSGSSPPDLVKSQRQAMEKAKGVEQVLQQSADQKREQVEQQK